MSIAHDETSPLSTWHANLTLTNQYGTDDDSSVDISKFLVHLAELGFLENSVQEYQIRAANFNQCNRCSNCCDNLKSTNPAAYIPQSLLRQLTSAFYRAWEAESNEELKASILLHASKQFKNKDLLGPGQARSQQTYDVHFDTNHDNDSNVSGNYIDYNICSINQYGEPFISSYDASEYDDNNPNFILIANTVSNVSSRTSKSKKKQPKSISPLSMGAWD